MTYAFRLLALILCLLAPLAGIQPALAAPASYALDQPRSSVRYFWEVNGAPSRGEMPVSAADLSLDFANVAASHVHVELNVAKATARLPFAQQAIRGPQILDAANHPRAVFQSTRVRADGTGARIDGQLTLRGVTRPLTLKAEIYRQQGSDAGDLSALTIRLTGTISRAAFGATGYPKLVGDTIRLDILARIDRIGS